MAYKEEMTGTNLAGSLPNELVLLAYYPVARSFGIERYDSNGENPEFFNTLTCILNPNFDVVAQFKRKSNADEYKKKVEHIKKCVSEERQEEHLERLEKKNDKREEDIDFLVSVKQAFFARLAKLTPEKIATFMDGVPVIEQEISSHNFLYLGATTLIASRDSLVWIYSEKNEPPKTSVVYSAQDKEKVDKALKRDKTFEIHPQKPATFNIRPKDSK